MANNKTNAWESSLLNLTFQNVNTPFPFISGLADGLRGSTLPGNLYLSLHTANPGEGGSQSTSEATYVPYARLPVARTAGQWTTSTAGTPTANVATLAFPICTAGFDTITHVGIGVDAVGAGMLIYYAPLSGGSLAVSNGITPQFAPGTLTIAEL